MSDRTALEIADTIGAMDYQTTTEAAAMLRAQHAEIERLTAVLSGLPEGAIEGGWTAAGICQYTKKCEDEISSLKRDRHHAYDLLARIHMDGGQYAAEHGIEKACDDAEAQVVTWLDSLENLDSLCEQAERSERESCALVCDDLMESIGITKDGFGACCENVLVSCADAIRARAKP